MQTSLKMSLVVMCNANEKERKTIVGKVFNRVKPMEKKNLKKDKRSKYPMRSRQPRPENLKKDKRSKKAKISHQPKSENPKDERAYDYYYYYYGNDYGSDYGN